MFGVDGSEPARADDTSNDSLDGVPFHLLDSCCQREVLNRRHAANVGRQLQRTDPSTARDRIRGNTLEQLLDHTTNQGLSSRTQYLFCHCCQTSSDYPLLERIRNDNTTVVDSMRYAKDSGNTYSGSDDCISPTDSDDELLAGIDHLQLQSNQVGEILQRRRKIEVAQQFGFAVHISDSPEHVLHQAILQRKLSVVLHICDPKSVHCAHLDLLLEELSMQYIGTLFRRIECSQLWQRQRLQNLLEPIFSGSYIDVSNRATTGAGSLLLFHDGKLLTFVNKIEAVFFSEEIGSLNILKGEVLRILSNAGILNDMTPSVEKKVRSSSLATFGGQELVDDGDDDTFSYCDDPLCARRSLYPHEHINSGQQGSYALPAQCIAMESDTRISNSSSKQKEEALEEFALSRI